MLNHTKKLAVDLKTYYEESGFPGQKAPKPAIDPIPVLTETGDGTGMLFFDDRAAGTTERLAGTWCGDLLQILDEKPENYTLINCYFVEVVAGAKYCYQEYGVNKDNYILKDNNGALYTADSIGYYGSYGSLYCMYVEPRESGIRVIPELIQDDDSFPKKRIYRPSNNFPEIWRYPDNFILQFM